MGGIIFITMGGINAMKILVTGWKNLRESIIELDSLWNDIDSLQGAAE